ncbi:helical bundle domain-containing protein [Legionella spiritensis]|uniref:Uncharacterized protein n=1 Tax=Legionella spiritensis TaxID=452 RepID=A0A0W0Z085_LEGSP|nr:helical bundle domain-containing protein [Legionella spiritensis]KTD62530.1 hypothetical protein Lspi_1742 [Legionella spiritensis]SNV30794.1 Uncharacterised protein [Legionella spiritensis]
MLTSTEEFLSLLRQGDYLAVLQWLQFINEKYKPDKPEKDGIDADTLLFLAVFELLNHGFSQKDEGLTIVILGLLDTEPRLFKEESAYAATVFFNASLQCLVYEQHHLLAFYQNPKLKDVNIIKSWMTRSGGYTPGNHEGLSEFANSKAVGEKFKDIEALLPVYQKSIDAAQRNIAPVMEYRDLILEYLDELSRRQEDDHCASVRLGVVLALREYLMGQTLVTAGVKDHISKYVRKLEEENPQPWENEYLARLSPKSISERLMETSRYTIRFFASTAWDNLMALPGTLLNSEQSGGNKPN